MTAYLDYYGGSSGRIECYELDTSIDPEVSCEECRRLGKMDNAYRHGEAVLLSMLDSPYGGRPGALHVKPSPFGLLRRHAD